MSKIIILKTNCFQFYPSVYAKKAITTKVRENNLSTTFCDRITTAESSEKNWKKLKINKR